MSMPLNYAPAPRFHAAAVDKLRDLDGFVQQAVAILAFAVLTALAAQVKFVPEGWSVPITLQTLPIYAGGLFLGWRNGMLAALVYVLAGLVLPIYSGGGSGISHLLNATGGYILGFMAAPAVGGWLTRNVRGPVGVYLSLMASSAALFTCGVTVLWLTTELSPGEALLRGWLIFIPIDLLKLLIVAGIYTGTRRATRREVLPQA